MYHEKIGAWLQSLPKPLALFAANDWGALDASQTCTFYDIHVPEEVAILGVGNDELACHAAQPKLSSIQLPLREIARESVKALAAKFAPHSSHLVRSIRLAPTALVTRASTQFFPTEDAIVSTALKYMATNISKPLKIRDLLNSLGISRPQLEKRFRAVLGRTPLVEFRRQRIERARCLLVDTEMSMREIGKLSGFSSEIRFSTVFREIAGMSPSEFRALHQPSR